LTLWRRAARVIAPFSFLLTHPFFFCLDVSEVEFDRRATESIKLYRTWAALPSPRTHRTQAEPFRLTVRSGGIDNAGWRHIDWDSSET